MGRELSEKFKKGISDAFPQPLYVMRAFMLWGFSRTEQENAPSSGSCWES